MTNVVIASAARTPVGSFNGSFANTPAHDLGAAMLEARVERAGGAKEDVSGGLSMGSAYLLASQDGVFQPGPQLLASDPGYLDEFGFNSFRFPTDFPFDFSLLDVVDEERRQKLSDKDINREAARKVRETLGSLTANLWLSPSPQAFQALENPSVFASRPHNLSLHAPPDYPDKQC